MTWSQLCLLLNHMAHTTDGQKILSQPVVIMHENRKNFMVCAGFEVLRDMSNLGVLTTTKRRGDEHKASDTGSERAGRQ